MLVGAPPLGLAQATANPRDFLLTDDDAGKHTTVVRDVDDSDGRARWAQRRWERERESTDITTGPIVIDNTVYVANDTGVASQIYNEQVAKQGEFPEATDKRIGQYEFPIKPAGDQISALSACDDCLANVNLLLHHRIVIRKGPVVSVQYLYGTEAVTTQDLAGWFAIQSLGHIPDGVPMASAPGPSQGAGSSGPGSGSEQAPQPAASAAPSPQAAASSAGVQARPSDLAIALGEAGKGAEKKAEADGSDARGAWYEVRYERDRDFGGVSIRPGHRVQPRLRRAERGGCSADPRRTGRPKRQVPGGEGEGRRRLRAEGGRRGRAGRARPVGLHGLLQHQQGRQRP